MRGKIFRIPNLLQSKSVGVNVVIVTPPTLERLLYFALRLFLLGDIGGGGSGGEGGAEILVEVIPLGT